MKSKIILTLVTLLICASGANAEMCTTTSTNTPTGTTPPVSRNYIQNCISVSYTNYYFSATSSTAVYSTPHCTQCMPGYSLITLDNSGEASWTASCEDNNPTFTICAKPCDSTCVNDNDWWDDSDGVDVTTLRTCKYDGNVCVETNSYRCAYGYYGESFFGYNRPECTLCPVTQTSYRQYGASNPDYDTYITDCYIQKNKPYLKDSTGIYSCSENAYYKN